MKVSLKEATKFHGHLGPYLVLGLLAGESALAKLRCRSHFGLDVKVYGASKKPKSCLIDGLQLSTGATYGKGNIKKFSGPCIRIEFCNRTNNKQINFKFKDKLISDLAQAKTHADAQALAKRLYRSNSAALFQVSTTTRS